MDDFKVTVEIPVQWGEMDSAQHVNNVIYLKWVEAARVKFFLELNGGKLVNQENIGPIVAWQDCKYIYPIKYPDTVIVGIRKLEVLDDRLITEAKIFSKTHNRLAAISKQQCMAYDFKVRRKAPLPLNWIYNES